MRFMKLIRFPVGFMLGLLVTVGYAYENLTDDEPSPRLGKSFVNAQFILSQNPDMFNRVLSDTRTKAVRFGINYGTTSWNYHLLHQENFESSLGDYSVTGTAGLWDWSGGMASHPGGAALDYLTSPVFDAPNEFADGTDANSIFLYYYGAANSANDFLSPQVNLVGDWHIDSYAAAAPEDINGSDLWWGGKPSAGGYENGDYQELKSTEITLTEAATLQFTHVYGFEEWGSTTGWDGGNVQVSTDDGITWATIFPDQGYSAPDGVYALDPDGYPNNMMPGYSNQQLTPETPTFDLSAFVGETIIIRWVYAADGSYDVHSQSTLIGWEIDDITITTVANSDILLTEDVDTDANFDNTAWAGLFNPISNAALTHMDGDAYAMADISALLLDASDDGKIRFEAESDDGSGSTVDDILVLASDRYSIDLGATALDISAFPFEVGQAVTFTVTATNMGMLPVRTYLTRIMIIDDLGNPVYDSGTDGYFYAQTLDGSDWFQALDTDMTWEFSWTPTADEVGKTYELIATTQVWHAASASFGGDFLNSANDAITKDIHIFPTGQAAFLSEDFTPLNEDDADIEDFGWTATSNWELSGNAAVDDDTTAADTLFSPVFSTTGGTDVWLEFDYSADTNDVSTSTDVVVVLHQSTVTGRGQSHGRKTLNLAALDNRGNMVSERRNVARSTWEILDTLAVGSGAKSYEMDATLTQIAFVSPVDYTLEIDNIVVYNNFEASFDTTAPAAPTWLPADAEDAFVTLHWNASTSGDVSYYNVYKSEDDTFANAIMLDLWNNWGNALAYGATTTETSHSDCYVYAGSYILNNSWVPNYYWGDADNNIIADSTYYYWVTAVDAGGNESDTSAVLAVTPTDATAPTDVYNLATTIGDRHLSLSWTEPVERHYDKTFNVFGIGELGFLSTGYYNSSILTYPDSAYDVRYSTTAPGTDLAAWWAAEAIPIDSIGVDQPDLGDVDAGEKHTLLIPDLAVQPTDYYFAFKVSDENDNTSAMSNVASRDKIAPARVFDLRVYDSIVDTLYLTWTATGDDGNVGTAAAYDIRYVYYDYFPEDEWDLSFAVADPSIPSAAGESDSIAVTVYPGFPVSFRLIITDESGHDSPLSNSATYLPGASFSPLSMDVGALPTAFGLAQNYPNPFNPTTEIEFALPEDASVVLTVYNMLGQEIRQLAAGEFSAGYHRVVWNGRDDFDRSMTSGMYFYRIKAGDFSKTMKMVLLK